MELPPLREREGDIELLLHWRLARHGAQTGQPSPEPSPEYLELLNSHDWPGNVRELLQTVDMSLVSALGERVLLPQHLPIDLRVRLMRGRVSARPDPPMAETPATAATAARLPPWREHRAAVLEQAEAAYFTALMNQAGGDTALASTLSGLKTARLYELLGKHGLVRARRGAPGIPEFPE